MQGVSSSFKLGRFYVTRHKAIRVKGLQRRCNLGKLLLWEYGSGYFPVLLCWNIQTLPVSSATNDSITCLIGIWRDRRSVFLHRWRVSNLDGWIVVDIRFSASSFWMRWKAVCFQKNETVVNICSLLAKEWNRSVLYSQDTRPKQLWK